MMDRVDLLKKDGSKSEGLPASVQRSKIYMMADTLIIEPGDLIRRHMSNGGEETYEVADPGFYEGQGGSPANYQMEVRRLGVPEAAKAVQSITYNVSGPNARINQNSVDNSTNVVTIDPRALELIAALRSQIECLSLPPDESRSAHEFVNAVQREVETGKPSKMLVSRLLAALPTVASIASIASSLLNLLGS